MADGDWSRRRTVRATVPADDHTDVQTAEVDVYKGPKEESVESWALDAKQNSELLNGQTVTKTSVLFKKEWESYEDEAEFRAEIVDKGLGPNIVTMAIRHIPKVYAPDCSDVNHNGVVEPEDLNGNGRGDVGTAGRGNGPPSPYGNGLIRG
jgi:hypothetical protein